MNTNKKKNYRPLENRHHRDQNKNEIVIARWTRVVGIFTVVLAIATIASAYFLWVTDETLRKTLEISQRPWISADVQIAGPLTFDKQKNWSHIPLKITLKNNGHSSAQDVRTFPVFYANKIPSIDRKELEEVRCRKPKNDTVHGDIGFTLFPGQISTDVLAPGLNSDEFSAAKSKFEENPYSFSPSIVVCVSYIATITKKMHFTTAFFLLSEITPSEPNLLRAIDLSKAPVSPANLHIMPLGSFSD